MYMLLNYIFIFLQSIKFYYVESVKDMRISPLNSDMKKAMNKYVFYLFLSMHIILLYIFI